MSFREKINVLRKKVKMYEQLGFTGPYQTMRLEGVNKVNIDEEINKIDFRLQFDPLQRQYKQQRENIISRTGEFFPIKTYKTISNLKNALWKLYEKTNSLQGVKPLHEQQKQIIQQLKEYGVKETNKSYEIKRISDLKRRVEKLSSKLTELKNQKFTIQAKILIVEHLDLQNILRMHGSSKSTESIDDSKETVRQAQDMINSKKDENLQTFEIELKNAPSKSNIDEAIQEYLDSKIHESTLIQYEVFDVKVMSNISIRKLPGKQYIPMRESTPLDLYMGQEGYSKESQFKYCVPDYIISYLQPYKAKLGIVKKLNIEYLFNLVKNDVLMNDNGSLSSEQRTIDDGFCSQDIQIISEDLGVSFICIDYFDDLIQKYSHQSKNTKVCLVFKCFNGHLYPIVDEGKRNSIIHTFASGKKLKPNEDEKEEQVFKEIQEY